MSVYKGTVAREMRRHQLSNPVILLFPLFQKEDNDEKFTISNGDSNAPNGH